MTIEKFWQDFLAYAGLNSTTKYYAAEYFGDNEELANSLLALVLQGKKRATASLLKSYEAENTPLPQVGSYSIITDFKGNPRCVIKTTNITVLPFNQITFDICKREGEDECLETWQEGHRRCFAAEGNELGFTFTEDMEVIFEDFQVIYQP